MIVATYVYTLSAQAIVNEHIADIAYGIAADTVSVAMPSRHYRSNPNVSWETFAREVAKQVCRAEASLPEFITAYARLPARAAVP